MTKTAVATGDSQNKIRKSRLEWIVSTLKLPTARLAQSVRLTKEK